ncbi:unnamed protein product, partial [Adineta steineri]
MLVTTDALFSWNIPFDDIEQYAAYLNKNSSVDMTEMFVCNCTRNRIGSSCQYEQPSGISTIGQIIENQISRIKDRLNEIITCLIDEIQCNTGLLCLEWRQICDGISQCDDGADETNCYLLEFNHCEKDEYQCRNGMCIPTEFLFDADFDCMDMSDEQENQLLYAPFLRCSKKSTWACDERLCRTDQFSCGDGECIHWSNLIHHRTMCDNLRDLTYNCETIRDFTTFPTGICRYNMKSVGPPNMSLCTTHLRNLLRGYQRKPALLMIIDHCPDRIQYPEQSTLSPVLKMFFDKSRIVSFYNFTVQNFDLNLPKVTADVVCFQGSMICNKIRQWVYHEHCMDFEQFQTLESYPFFPISYLFCQAANSYSVIPSDSDEVWQTNEDKGSSYTCNQSDQVISQRRINDGYTDCLLGDDEINQKQTILEPYQYRCITEESRQFVSYQQLGNKVHECIDGSDEISVRINWNLFLCEYPDDYACEMFRNHQVNDIQLLFQRHCDSIWDTMDGNDERNCSYWKCSSNMYQCRETGQCIDRTWICDGEFDCNNGDDERNCSKFSTGWTLQSKCNQSIEYFCITFDFLSNTTFNRPCISNNKIGDEKIDCLGGRDERNVLSCSDHQMLGDRFMCDNQTKCIAPHKICNGFTDCFDQTDELICFWDRGQCKMNGFACSSGRKCLQQSCNKNQTCPNGEHFLWCPRNTSVPYRFNKVQRTSEYVSFCHSYVPKALLLENRELILPTTNKNEKLIHEFCNRGFYLLTQNGSELDCFCPPSFYGHRCQYNRRRITVVVRLERRHRSDLPFVFHVLVLLICNRSIIIDHQIFADIDQDFFEKYQIYLLYSRPRLRCIYSVRFEAYHGNRFISFWEYLITPLDFLPVFRLVKILRFPDRTIPWLCSQNLCLNNGTCYVDNENSEQSLCICQRGWYGASCEKLLEHSECSADALVRDLDVCVCPHTFLFPHCHIQNTICQQANICTANQTCYALSVFPPNQYTCLCHSSQCLSYQAFLMLHRSKPNEQPILVQLLKLSSAYPRLRQQFLIEAWTEFPVKRLMDTYDKRKKTTGLVPEVGLLYTFTPEIDSVTSVLNILYINCTNNHLFDIIIDLDVQLQQCHFLMDNIHQHHSIKLYHSYCQDEKFSPCFYSDNYVCYCSIITNRSECLTYRQHSITCSYCINHGLCLRGDLQNRNDFVCICPKCVSGDLCQFSLNRFSISLEMLIEKTRSGFLTFVGPLIFLLIGIVFNGLTFFTFSGRKARGTSIGFFLFLSSIISQLVLVLLFTRVAYLVVARKITIDYRINEMFCKILPYLMLPLNYFSLWLMIFVTVGRAVAVAKPIRFRSFQTVSNAIILSILTFIILFGSCYFLIDQYKLILHPEDS